MKPCSPTRNAPKAEDMGNFYRVPADNRGLNYDKFFKEGDEDRNVLTEFNSNNTRQLNVEETKRKSPRSNIFRKSSAAKAISCSNEN